MNSIKRFFLSILLTVAGGVGFAAADEFGEATEGLEKQDGLASIYLDHQKARVLLALQPDSEDGHLGRFIYAAYLTAGLGSNPMGLDRSLPTGSRMLQFRRAGNKVMAVIENMDYRASADSAEEKKAVKTSFAESIIWSTDIVAEDAAGAVLIDLSGFLKRDMVGVASRLKARGQGSFRLDDKRSYVDTKAAFSFPINMEFDAHITFAGANPGREVQVTTPVPEAVTLVAHTSLMKLPEAGYEVRGDDERAGLISVSHVDMSAPLDGDTVVRMARRFRLQKDADGNIIKPIVFYIDNAAPEPIRGALLDGARWWATAFEKAGFPGGYRAEILPEGVHPLDARYNVVNWVHRATRGWSYGAAIHDPRTGEALRGVVLLGSLRVRQDIKIFEALAGAGKTGTGAEDDPVKIALARIRQLSAHEIGHSLGFAHNMAASTYGGRASVMDYPAPDVRLVEDELDFSNAYGVGVGSWDDWTVNFLYGDYDAPEKEAQARLVAEADAAGLLYVSDGDSRSVGSGHAQGALWDTGEDALESLANTMAVRRYSLDKFGAENLRKGESFTALQTKFVPLYLYHRYQLQAAVKLIGGYEFTYRHQGDNRQAPAVVSEDRQQAALEALLDTLGPATLDVSPEVLRALTPLGYAGGDPQFNRETFTGNARPAFDLTETVSVASDLTLEALLHPRRLLRVYEQGLAVDDTKKLSGMLNKVVSDIVRIPRRESARHTELRKITVEALTERLIDLSQHAQTVMPVRTHAVAALAEVRSLLGRYGDEHGVFAKALRQRIDTAAARSRTPAVKDPARPATPPGSPIGATTAEGCWHCS